MWDLSWKTPLGSVSMRKFLPGFAAVIVAFLASLTLTTEPTYAADATWSGQDIVYENNTYKASTTPARPATPNDAAGTYLYQASTSDVRIIYFQKDTDPKTATSAQYITATFTPTNGLYTPNGSASTISLAQQNAPGAPPSGSAEAEESTSSCAISGGLGWIICPLTNTLASAMDYLFTLLSSFLAVDQNFTDTNGGLYRTWSWMRNLANIAFAIGFLVIIYSQITNIGLTNYGIKRLLPRLIAAAILVNISYWVCAIAIDLSNIAGASLEDIFMSLRDQIIANGQNSWQITSWESVASLILSGGTALTVAGIGAFAFGATAGSIFMLLPFLIGVLMAVLVALLVLAVRQALIVILVIISPLAFVAFLLPNTEKYFDRWRNLFFTMLFLFPAFSVIFGGSQLAGTAIIQAAHGANSISMLLLGMAVQVAPVVVTPMLVKLSGSLVGRIAGMVNNPNKGIVDRTRKFAQSRSEEHKDRAIATGNGLLARRARAIDTKRRARKDWQSAHQARRDNAYHGSSAYAAINQANRELERDKKTIEAKHDLEWNVKIHTDPTQIQREFESRTASLKADYEKARVDVAYDEFKAGNQPIYGPMTREMSHLMDETQDASRGLALTSMRKQMAERAENVQTTNALLKNTDRIDGELLRDYAGGVMGQTGAESVLARAVSSEREEYNKNVQNKLQLMKHFNLDSGERQALALGSDVTKSKDGVEYSFKRDDIYAREAAIEQQLKAGSFAQIEEIIKESYNQTNTTGDIVAHNFTPGAANVTGRTGEFATTIADAIVANGIPNKAIYFGSKTIDDVSQGKIRGDTGLNNAVIYNLQGGKVSDEKLAAMSADAIKRMFEVGENPYGLVDFQSADATKQQTILENAQAMKYSARRILDHDTLSRIPDAASRRILERYAEDEPGNNLTA